MPYDGPGAKMELHRKERESLFSRRGRIGRRQQNGLRGQGFPEGGFQIDFFSPGRLALTPKSTVCHSFCGKFPQGSAREL